MTVADLKPFQERMRQIAHEHGATELLVFGSTVDGRARPDSDVDLLVELEPGRSLLDLIAIKQDLEDLLGREVDVVTRGGLDDDVLAEVTRTAHPL